MRPIANVSAFATKLARYFGCVVYFGCVGHCIMEYIGDIVICMGPSMEPTLFSENVVFAERISILLLKIKRGSIVITRSPSNPKGYICKRIIGIPGDKIRCQYFSQIVPRGHVWLEGDNKYNSCDSRDYGPVPQGLIRGRVICRIWPLDSIQMLTSGTKTKM